MAASGTSDAARPDHVTAGLESVVELSHAFGADTEFTRAGGGNSSVKVDGILYIKPSGASLADLTAGALVPLRVGPLLELLDSPPGAAAPGGTDEVMRVALDARVGNADGRRPSVECLFHALLPERFILHTHPTTVNALTCSARGAELTAALFGDGALWVPYTDPGLPLARAIRDIRREHEQRTGHPAPRAMLLQNHGLIVAGDTIEEVARTSHGIVDGIRAEIDRSAEFSWGDVAELDPDAAREALCVVGPVLRAALAADARLRIVTFDDGSLARGVAGSGIGASFASAGPLTPDQIVYVGSWPLVLDPVAETGADELAARTLASVERYAAAHGTPPTVVLVPGLGLFAAGDTYRAAATARDVYLDAIRVSMLAHRLGGLRPLADAERQFIERWEAEEYRRGVAAGSGPAGRARGLVAVVTGAAQGFGLAIASDFVAEGAHVALADVNATQAAAEADRLVAGTGPGRAVGLPIDVTDEASVRACFVDVVRQFGGFDVLVSNAGILRAGSVTSQPVGEFDAVTRVNYRGYFLCVRAAAPILARQHRAKPAYWGDIVEINSKSGLVGSSRNSAYAGSKFGGIGLTQSFALELVGDGIKVNAICPGNFLEGPLWSDPENGLFVQYLREGKVPGARTIDDVRRFYEAKVPMGRGCTPADVLEAIYYVIAQRYETGQAIPVTGGQVMLS